jgi:hypothetical protein
MGGFKRTFIQELMNRIMGKYKYRNIEGKRILLGQFIFLLAREENPSVVKPLASSVARFERCSVQIFVEHLKH